MIAKPRMGARYSPLRQVVMQDKRNMGVLMVRRKEAVSPHTLMGISCTILGLSIMIVTTVIITKRYHQAAQYQDTMYVATLFSCLFYCQIFYRSLPSISTFVIRCTEDGPEHDLHNNDTKHSDIVRNGDSCLFRPIPIAPYTFCP